MKKLFTFVFLVIAIASFGGTILSAHADTALTPEQAAALQAQLDTLKASLAQLQTQANAQAASPSVPAPQPSSLTAEDAAALRGALSSLATVLGNLQMQFAAHPELAAQNAPAVSSALQGMAKTLAMIGTTIVGANASPIALAQPIASDGAIAQSVPLPAAPAALVPSVTPAQPLVSANTNQAVNANQVAQISSASPLKNLNWPLIIVVILVVAAVALWLFWPESDDGKKVVKVASSMPPAPVVTVMPQQQPQISRQPLLQQQNQQQRQQPQVPQQQQHQRRPA